MNELDAVRRRLASDAEVNAALVALDGTSQLRADTWPGELANLDAAGVYSWWVDHDGAADLTRGLGHPVHAARIYAGQTGATRWPSGKTGEATLLTRITRNHLRGRIRSSTFRLTLAAALRDVLKLQAAGPTRLATESEDELSRWIGRHLAIAVHRFRDPDPLEDLEHRMLRVFDPPLNLRGMPPTPLRLALSRLRSQLSS